MSKLRAWKQNIKEIHEHTWNFLFNEIIFSKEKCVEPMWKLSEEHTK
jgi:hypothetical protein